MPRDDGRQSPPEMRTAWWWFSAACALLAVVSVVAGIFFRPSVEGLFALALIIFSLATGFIAGYRQDRGARRGTPHDSGERDTH